MGRYLIAVLAGASALSCSRIDPSVANLASVFSAPGPKLEFVSGLPSSSHSNESTFSIQTGGTGMVAYRYKIADAIPDCADESGYVLTETAVATPIPLDFAARSDGEVVLCAVGKNDDDEWTPFTRATAAAWVLDRVKPRVLSVSTSAADGAYGTLSVIEIIVKFNEDVVLDGGGVPRISMNTGGLAYWQSVLAPGPDSLRFLYTVSSGEEVGGLDHDSIGAFDPSGVAIRDAAGNDAELELPAPGSATSISGVKNIRVDTQAPAHSGSVAVSESWTNSLTKSPVLSWPPAIDSGSGIDHYEVAIGTTPAGAETMLFQSVGGVTNHQFLSLSLSEGTTYYPKVRAVDVAGNIGPEIGGISWTVDATAPTLPGFFDDGDVEYQDSQSPVLSWSAGTDVGSGIQRYEIAFGSSAGLSDLASWQDAGTGTTAVIAGTFAKGSKVYASLRAKDAAGNVSNIVGGDGWIVAQPLWMTDSTVQAIERYGDTVLVGGSFNYLGPRARGSAELDPVTGQLAHDSDVVAEAAPAGSVSAIVPWNGRWIVGGSFMMVGTVTRNGLAVLEADGRLSSMLLPTMGAGSVVKTLLVEGDTLYVGGSFATVDGQPRKNLAAIDLGSMSVLPWDPSPDGDVLALAADGGALYVGGSFAKIDGQTRNRVAALDSATGFATAWNPNANNTVSALAVAGSTVYATGAFSSIGGQTRNRIAALDSATGFATAWNPQLDGAGSALAIDGGRLFVGGNFLKTAGQTRGRGAAYDLASGDLLEWDPGASGAVNAVAVDGGRVRVGGSFYSVGGVRRERLAQIDLRTGEPTPWAPRLNKDFVSALKISGASVFVGGNFTEIDGAAHTGLARLTIGGAATSWDPQLDNAVNVLEVADGKLYVGGVFGNVGSEVRTGLAAFEMSDLSLVDWSPVLVGLPSATVSTLKAIDGRLYVSGAFETVDGVLRSKAAAFNLADGSLTGWDPQVNDMIYDLLPFEGDLLLAGEFTTVGGSPFGRLVRVNSSTGGGASPIGDLNGLSRSLLLRENMLYTAGQFTDASTQTRNGGAAIDLSAGNLLGGWAPSLNPASVRKIVDLGGAILVGGTITRSEAGVQNLFVVSPFSAAVLP